MSFWFDADSPMILAYCGETTLNPLPHSLPFTVNKDNKLSTALDKSDAAWIHNQDHVHYIWFDLGKPLFISSIRGLLNATTNISEAHFYIGNDPADMGDPVLMIIDFQDYTPSDSYRYDLSIPKLGRYVLIVIGKTTDPNNYLRWG